MKNTNELVFINKDELLSHIEESIKRKVEEANNALINNLRERFPSDEILSLEDLARRLNRSEPTVRNMAVALGITPHVYAKNKPPYYILSEVILALKKADPVDWYIREREKLMEENSKQNNPETKLA